MILIRFTDAESKRRALEALVGEFPFKSWSSGEMLVPEEALTRLAREDVPFTYAGFKDRLKTRFQQIDIWLTSHSIEVSVANRPARLPAKRPGTGSRREVLEETFTAVKTLIRVRA